MRVKKLNIYIYSKEAMQDTSDTTKLECIGSPKDFPKTFAFKNKYEERNSHAFRRDYKIDLTKQDEVWYALEFFFTNCSTITKRFKTRKVDEILDQDGNSIKEKEIAFSGTGYIKDEHIVIKSITQTNDMIDFDISFLISELEEEDLIDKEDFI